MKPISQTYEPRAAYIDSRNILLTPMVRQETSLPQTLLEREVKDFNVTSVKRNLNPEITIVLTWYGRLKIVADDARFLRFPTRGNLFSLQ